MNNNAKTILHHYMLTEGHSETARARAVEILAIVKENPAELTAKLFAYEDEDRRRPYTFTPGVTDPVQWDGVHMPYPPK